MKIFGFFVDQSKRLMALGVIVLILLTSEVGIVSGAYYFSKEDCPLCTECGMKINYVDRDAFHETFPPYSGWDSLACQYHKLNEEGYSLGSGAFGVRFYTDEKLASDWFAKGVKTAQYWIDKEDEEDDQWISHRKITLLDKDDETFQSEEIHYMSYRREEVRYYKYNGIYLYHKKYVIYIKTEYHKDKNDAKKAFDALVKCAKAVVDEKDIDSKVSFTLEHYPPFPYLAGKEKAELRPIGAPIGGDLVATLKDKDGKGIPHEKVVFYAIKEENPQQKEPGKNLRGVLKPAPTLAFEAPIYDILNIDQYTYLDVYSTDDKGEAKVNYILQNLIDPKEFSKTLLQQSYMHGEDGKIGGTIKAVVLERKGDEWKIKYEVSIPIEFKGIAKILKISGKGWKDDAFPYEPGRAAPGEIRVTRPLAYPSFENKEVEEGFLLMPGDIITIDGGVTVDIGWINGNKAIAKVPKHQMTKSGSLPVPDLSLTLNPTAYESGFHTRLEKEIIAPLFGLTVEKGVDYVLECCGVVGKTTKFLNDVRKKYKKVDLSEIDLIAKIRVRSTVRVDSTGDEIHIYNIEGSPDIKTVKGEEVTLADKEMVTISENGSLSKVQSFDPEKVLNEFYDTIPSTTDVTGLTFESHSKPRGSSVQIPLTLNGIEDKIGNMDITLSYDPSVLEATEVTKGDLTSDSLFEYNIMAGTILISLADAEGFSGNGSIAYVTFDVIGAANSTSPLQIAALTVNRAEDYEVLTIPTNDGVFRVIF
ncbi:hypothetical protein KA005_19595, partial [bacterium]|nr:hypothetical protein [bacterium]